MAAVIDLKASVIAFPQCPLLAIAREVIQQNRARPKAKVGLVFDPQSRPAFHLAARNFCLLHAPAVVAD